MHSLIALKKYAKLIHFGLQTETLQPDLGLTNSGKQRQ